MRFTFKHRKVGPVGRFLCKHGIHKVSDITSMDMTTSNIRIIEGKYCKRCKTLIIIYTNEVLK